MDTRLLIVLFLMVFPIAYLPIVHADGGSWTTKSSMPTARYEFGVAVVNGKIFAIGGTEYVGGAKDAPLATVEEYDPATDLWVSKTPMPTPRGAFSIAVWQDKIYVFGGYSVHVNEMGPIWTTEVYDPSTDSWTTKADMPSSIGYVTANVVDDSIHLIGGSGVTNDPVKDQIYDPVKDSWTTKGFPTFASETPWPHPVECYASAVVDNKIYLLGGDDPHYGEITDWTQIYYPANNSWSQGAPMPYSLAEAASSASAGIYSPKRIYVMGGRNGNVTSAVNQAYDPENNVWTIGTPMPTARYGLGLAVVNDALYAIGGLESNGNTTGKMEEYTPAGFDPLQAVPEFPTLIIMPLFIITTLMISTIYKRRHKDLEQSKKRYRNNADQCGYSARP